MPPLHQRTEKLIKDKQKLLERQRNSKKELEDKDIAKSCTFRPTSSSRNSSRSRSPECITKELYKWNERRKKSIDQQRQEKESLESTKLISKPRIDNLSQKLSKIVKNYIAKHHSSPRASIPPKI